MGTTGRRKTYRLDGELIAQVRGLFNARTDAEAIHGALRRALEDHEIKESLERFLRAGRFRTVYR